MAGENQASPDLFSSTSLQSSGNETIVDSTAIERALQDERAETEAESRVSPSSPMAGESAALDSTFDQRFFDLLQGMHSSGSDTIEHGTPNRTVESGQGEVAGGQEVHGHETCGDQPSSKSADGADYGVDRRQFRIRHAAAMLGDPSALTARDLDIVAEADVDDEHLESLEMSQVVDIYDADEAGSPRGPTPFGTEFDANSIDQLDGARRTTGGSTKRGRGSAGKGARGRSEEASGSQRRISGLLTRSRATSSTGNGSQLRAQDTPRLACVEEGTGDDSGGGDLSVIYVGSAKSGNVSGPVPKRRKKDTIAASQDRASGLVSDRFETLDDSNECQLKVLSCVSGSTEGVPSTSNVLNWCENSLEGRTSSSTSRHCDKVTSNSTSKQSENDEMHGTTLATGSTHVTKGLSKLKRVTGTAPARAQVRTGFNRETKEEKSAAEARTMDKLICNRQKSLSQLNVWRLFVTGPDMAAQSNTSLKTLAMSSRPPPPPRSEVVRGSHRMQFLKNRANDPASRAASPASETLTPAGDGTPCQTDPAEGSSPSNSAPDDLNVTRNPRNETQIEGPSLRNSFGFDMTYADLQHIQASPTDVRLAVLSLELHAHGTGRLSPNPAFNPICLAVCVVYDKRLPEERRTVVMAVESGGGASAGKPGWAVGAEVGGASTFKVVASERELIDEVVSTIQHHDPDILVGYEIQQSSWGYFLERCSALGLNMCPPISRLPTDTRGMTSKYSTADGWWALSDIHVSGRIVLNLWRIMKAEVTLNRYTAENVAYNVLRKRLPAYSAEQLTRFCEQTQTSALGRWRVLDYVSRRARLNVDLILHTDLIGRTAELAKLFGIQFFDVLTRGSQFRVESMLFRLSRERGYLGISPSVKQRASMAAPECIPLTMEPESRFYKDPVVVVDFQSLYPSVMIAYNYCYSTCLGKVGRVGENPVIEFGVDKLSVPLALVEKLLGEVHISPAGVAFVKRSVRTGVIPVMLDEIISTRLMVKKALKKCAPHEKGLKRVLEARQLGLKYIANFTYGYTSANFSGRMPCAEVADTIVHQGRRTLEKAIEMVQTHPTWGGRVVYGDTDSMFILLAGRSKEEAFRIGQDIADAVTLANPSPVKLKFEKVYYPCVLQTKKRYAGYSYETSDQTEPTFDAKGIETVRRDTCRAVSKILERSLRILFETKSPVPVRLYLERQLSRIRMHRVNIRDFVFAKEYRGRANYSAGAVIPALSIARARSAVDPRAEPRIGERVPYVIVAGAPGATLISCVREPSVLATTPSARLNSQYYIMKHILPSLHRCMSLANNSNVFEWYRGMKLVNPAIQQAPVPDVLNAPDQSNDGRLVSPSKRAARMQKTLTQFYSGSTCVSCKELTTRPGGLCSACRSDPAAVGAVIVNLNQSCNKVLVKQAGVGIICGACMGVSKRYLTDGQSNTLACSSIDCPIYFKYYQLERDFAHAAGLRMMLDDCDF